MPDPQPHWEHVYDADTCWCSPEVEESPNGDKVIFHVDDKQILWTPKAEIIH